jgi:hypothetical protein
VLGLLASRRTRWKRAASAASAVGALVVAGCLLVAAIWPGCSIYNPSLLLPAPSEEAGPDVAPVDAAVTDAGVTDAGDVGVDAAVDLDVDVDVDAADCSKAHPPAPPSADDPSDAGDQTFIVALHTLDFGLSPEAGALSSLGYDLDGVATCCGGAGESCRAAVVAAPAHCDDPGGRDDSAGHLLRSLASLSSQFNDMAVSQRLQQGAYSVLLQVLHYNGQPNDTQVTAALYAADGIEAPADGASPVARWDGTDVWTIDDAFVVTADASPLVPTHFDGNAYVAGGTIVVHVDFPISVGSASSGDLTLMLTSGLITGEILPAGGGTYRLTNGQIAGRWNNSALLSAIQSLSLPPQLGSGNICHGTPEYVFVKQEVCQYSDIMTNPLNDNTGATCDALSIGLGFTADPAQMGDVVPSVTNPDFCDGGALIPDDCTIP